MQLKTIRIYQSGLLLILQLNIQYHTSSKSIRYAYDETGYLIGEKARVGEDTWKEIRYQYSPGGKLLRRMVRLKGEDTETAQETRSRISKENRTRK